jgi:hypothetical protein
MTNGHPADSRITTGGNKPALMDVCHQMTTDVSRSPDLLAEYFKCKGITQDTAQVEESYVWREQMEAKWRSAYRAAGPLPDSAEERYAMMRRLDESLRGQLQKQPVPHGTRRARAAPAAAATAPCSRSKKSARNKRTRTSADEGTAHSTKRQAKARAAPQRVSAPRSAKTAAATSSVDPEDEQACVICSELGDADCMIICDGCEDCYHTYCNGLDMVPEGDWFCHRCCDKA